MAYQFAKGYPRGEFLLPSVTKIIGDCTDKSRALTQWSANSTVLHIKQHCIKTKGNFPHYRVNDEQLNAARFNFRNISDTALEIGHAVHSAIEQYLRIEVCLKTSKEQHLQEHLVNSKDSDKKNPSIIAGFDAFLEWMDEHKVKPIAIEETVYGNYFAGTLDLRCNLNGVPYVIDFKTSKAIYANDYGPQIAAYRSTFPDVEGCGILRLDKETGLPEWKDFSDRYEKDLKVFNKMVELYMLRHKIIANKAGWKEN